jgi:hypothetical protein
MEELELQQLLATVRKTKIPREVVLQYHCMLVIPWRRHCETAD